VSPTPAAIGGPAYVCINAEGAYTHAVSGGTWSSSNPAVGSIDAGTGVLRGIAAGSVRVTYVSGNGCFITKIVNVANNPSAIAGSLSVCEASSSALTCVIGGSATWSSSNTAVATIGITSGMMAGVSSGTAIITYRLNTTGCYSTTIATINALPAVITGSNAICVGSAQVYSSATTGGTWSSSNTAVAAIGSATGMATGGTGGSASLSYTLATGCRRVKPVTVNLLPASISGTTVYCVGGSAVLTTTTTGGTWSSDDAAATIAGTGAVTATNTGTSVINYTLPTSCIRSVTVTVNAVLPANTGNNNICMGGTTVLSNSVTGGTWSSSVAAKASVASASGIVSGVAAGTSNISYIRAGAGCLSVTQVTVNAALAAITGTLTACVGNSSTLAHTLSGGTWSASNTSLATVDASTGVVTGVAGGTPVITYTASPGCFKTANFTVKSLPAAITGVSSVCTSSAIVLYGSPTGGSWTSSDVAVATINSLSGALTGISSGTVNITYRGANGCSIATTRTVNATPAPITGTFNVAVGGSRILSNATPSGIWSSGNSTFASVSAGSSVVTGIATGAALITYALPNGCFRSVTFTVTAAKGQGLENTTAATFVAYPNPVFGLLHIDASADGIFQLLSTDGKLVMTVAVKAGSTTLDLPGDLAAGIYVGRYIAADGNTAFIRLQVQ
jgi:uncharacterized protein YjdB